MSMTNNPVQEILGRLQRVKQTSGDSWMGCCPSHDDKNPSLSVKIGDDGRVLLWCFTGCSVDAICDSLDMKQRDLFISDPSRGTAYKTAGAKPKKPKGKVHPTLEAAMEVLGRLTSGTLVASWVYQRRDGAEAFRVVRMLLPAGGKDYRPLHPTEGGWKIGDPNGALPLYRLPELAGHGRVYVVEGEKCADAANAIGLLATTSAHGAKGAKKTDWSPLAGREIVLCPDNNKAGEEFVESVARIIAELDTSTHLRVLRLPDLPEGGDIVDYIRAQSDRDEHGSSFTLRKNIEALADDGEVLHMHDLVGGPLLTCLADIQPEEIDWLWPGRIALGKLTIIAGDPGLGKSFITFDLAARVTKGTQWPDAPDARAPLGSVIILNMEDDPADTIRPRLDRMGADVSKIRLLQGVRQADERGKLRDTSFNLDRDMPALEKAITSTPGAKLVIIDPISACLGDVDSHKNADIRGLLAPLSKLASDYRVAIVLVTHLNKGAGSGVYRVIGSLAFVAVARSAWGLVRDADNPEGRKFLPIKSNISKDTKGLTFSIADGAVAWGREPIDQTWDEALSEGGGSVDAEGANDAEEFVRNELSEVDQSFGELSKAARDQGISEWQLRRALKRAGATSTREGFGKGSRVIWHLESSILEVAQDSPVPNTDQKYAKYEENGEKRVDSGYAASILLVSAGAQKYDDGNGQHVEATSIASERERGEI